MRARTATSIVRRLALVLTPLCLITFGAGCHSTPATTRLQAQDEEQQDKELAQIKTIGDVTDVGNAAPVPVSGVGLVVNLEGTGGPSPPSWYRTMLEAELRKQQVKNIKAVLSDPDKTMVLVSGLILPGSRKGDPIDIAVFLPEGSKATSLRGGTLLPCSLRDFDNTMHLNPHTDKGDHLVLGHIIGRAQGQLLTGFESGSDEEGRLRKGRIWEGGVSFIERPFLLTLKNDQKFAKVAAAVAERINTQFQDDPQRQLKLLQNQRLLMLSAVTGQLNETFAGGKVRNPLPGKGEVALPFGKSAISVAVPWDYRLNPERYLRVVRLVPLRALGEERDHYRQLLQTMLLDPAKCVRAALRLEALGKSSIPTLKTGLQSPHPLVRFCSAEALTYLGCPIAADELAILARQYDSLRAYCLVALASLDEPSCRERLCDLLEAPIPELRYGAFRALRLLDDTDPHIQGKMVNGSFWLHLVCPDSPALIHYTQGQRCEVVLFGKDHRLTPPFAVRAQEFTVKAEIGDDRCYVCRYMLHEGRTAKELCPLTVEDMLWTMAKLGAQYPDVIEALRSLDEVKALSCPVKCNAVPTMMPVEELAGLGRNADAWRLSTAGSGQQAAGSGQ
jgi:hypothetical protein